MKKIAVIILNWNGADLLRKFLPSVCAHTNAHIADVIVVDNGSDDNSVEVLKQEFPQVKTLLFPQNCGFAAGYNKALEMLDYKYAVLLNSDVETTPHWLEPLLEFAEDNPDVAACQPKIKSLRRREKFEYAGAAGGFIDRYGYPFCRGRIFNTLETDRGQYNDICDIFWASGAALFVRAEIYKKVGGLDPSFFAHMEEIDLCWRIPSRRIPHRCRTAKLGLSLGRSIARCRQSPENLSQLSQQPFNVAQEPALQRREKDTVCPQAL